MMNMEIFKHFDIIYFKYNLKVLVYHIMANIYLSNGGKICVKVIF